MARQLKRLYGPAQIATGPTTIYTAPTYAGTPVGVTQTHWLHVQNPSGSPVTFTLSIGADAAGTRLYDAYSMAAGAVLSVPFPHALAGGQIITVSAGTNNILVITIDGFEGV